MVFLIFFLQKLIMKTTVDDIKDANLSIRQNVKRLLKKTVHAGSSKILSTEKNILYNQG